MDRRSRTIYRLFVALWAALFVVALVLAGVFVVAIDQSGPNPWRRWSPSVGFVIAAGVQWFFLLLVGIPIYRWLQGRIWR